MGKEGVITIYAVYQRKLEDVNSFLAVPIELRKAWVNHKFVIGMARFVRELRNLDQWEFVCYYHDKITE